MKKILIVNSNMQIGGIQKALVNMLNEIGDEYYIDLLLFDNQGSLINSIPPSINILPTNNKLRILGRSNEDCKSLGKYSFLLSCFLRLISRYTTNRASINYLTGRQILPKKYDVAISYMQPGSTKFLYGGCAKYVYKNVNAEKKIAFIHCDYQKYDGNEKANTDILSKFDEIVCVSESCAKHYIDATNQDPDCVNFAYNFTNYTEIRKLSNNIDFRYKEGIVHFVTVARLSQEKGLCETIQIVRKIIESGELGFQWHIVGDGHLRKQISQMIDIYGLSNTIILHGGKENPYPYIRQATCMIVCSLHEAAPMVYEESACLGVPILTTKTCSSSELVVKKGYGIEAKSDNELLTHMKMIISDKTYLDRFRKELNEHNFTNKVPFEQIKSIIGDKNGS